MESVPSRVNLREVLEKILTCDVLLLGSPIYFPVCLITGDRSVFQGEIVSALVYSMNVTEEQMNYEAIFKQNQALLELFHGQSEVLFAINTYQFKDYSMYEASKFDGVRKVQVNNHSPKRL